MNHYRSGRRGVNMEHLYLNLPSNGSPLMYPQNTSANFTSHLAKQIRLDGDWEAALLELQYVNTIFNVSEGENYIVVRLEDSKSAPHDLRTVIPPGHYRNEAMFVEAINQAVKTILPNLPYFLATNESGYITTRRLVGEKKIGNQIFKTRAILLAPHIQRQLGLPSLEIALDSEHKALYPVDVSAGIATQIFVYCDKIVPTYIGHCLAPLLRTVPVAPEKFGTAVTYTVERPLYFPISSLCFDTLEINLRDSVGRSIPFAYGTSGVLLELRRRV